MIPANLYRYYVGIDVSKHQLVVCLDDRKTDHQKFYSTDNTSAGFTRLGEWLRATGAGPTDTVLCSEHTGRYGEHLQAWAAESGWRLAVEKTTILQKVGPEHHRKSDRFDARKLAEYAWRHADELQLQTPVAPEIERLKRLRAERRFMVDRRASLKQKRTEAPYHATEMDAMVDMWEEQIQMISRHIQQLETRMQELIDSSAYLSTLYKRVRSVDGVGPVIGRFWVSEFAGQSQLNARRISSRFGFAPLDDSSGIVDKGARSSGFGQGNVRRIFHQAARSISASRPHYINYYQRKKAEGKSEQLIINNIINKIIRTICAVWNKKTMFDPGYQQRMRQQQKQGV